MATELESASVAVMMKVDASFMAAPSMAFIFGALVVGTVVLLHVNVRAAFHIDGVRERSQIGLWSGDGLCYFQDLAVVQQAESLDQMHLVARGQARRFQTFGSRVHAIRKIAIDRTRPAVHADGIHHQDIALPMSDRMTFPAGQPVFRGRMLAAVHVDAARHRNPLVEQHDLVMPLQDLRREESTDKARRIDRVAGVGRGQFHTQASLLPGLLRAPGRELRFRCVVLVGPFRIVIVAVVGDRNPDAEDVGSLAGSRCVRDGQQHSRADNRCDEERPEQASRRRCNTSRYRHCPSRHGILQTALHFFGGSMVKSLPLSSLRSLVKTSWTSRSSCFSRTYETFACQGPVSVSGSSIVTSDSMVSAPVRRMRST